MFWFESIYWYIPESNAFDVLFTHKSKPVAGENGCLN